MFYVTTVSLYGIIFPETPVKMTFHICHGCNCSGNRLVLSLVVAMYYLTIAFVFLVSDDFLLPIRFVEALANMV